MIGNPNSVQALNGFEENDHVEEFNVISDLLTWYKMLFMTWVS